MQSFTEVEAEIEAAKNKRKQLILEAMDGRTQKSISDKTGIDQTKLSKWINGFASLEEKEIKLLQDALGTDFK